MRKHSAKGYSGIGSVWWKDIEAYSEGVDTVRNVVGTVCGKDDGIKIVEGMKSLVGGNGEGEFDVVTEDFVYIRCLFERTVSFRTSYVTRLLVASQESTAIVYEYANIYDCSTGVGVSA